MRVTNPELSFSSDRYKPKLTFDERCFALALFEEGASWSAIASFFGVHRRTVEMIKNGPPYKSVRDAFGQLGRDAFVARYLDAARFNDFKEFVRRRREGDPEFNTTKQSTDPNAPNWYANPTAKAKEGVHHMKHTTTGEMVVVSIFWRGAMLDSKPGWYYSVDDKVSPRPYATSTEAVEHSRDIWDAYNGPTEKALREAVLERQARRDAAKQQAGIARQAMLANPSLSAIQNFADLAKVAMMLQGVQEQTANEQLADIGWWLDDVELDPRPFGYEPPQPWIVES
jgi:hypothetical protein